MRGQKIDLVIILELKIKKTKENVKILRNGGWGEWMIGVWG